jgi:hypothetical protein
VRKIVCVAVSEDFVEHDTRQAQLDRAGLTAEGIAARARALSGKA